MARKLTLFSGTIAADLRRWRHDVSGATAVEYTMVAAVTCVAIIAAYAVFTPEFTLAINTVAEKINP